MEPQRNEPISERIVVRMTPRDAKRLAEIQRQGGYPHKATLIRSLLRAILEDDAKAHGKG